MNFWDILLIIINFAGALAVFLFGMKLMSEGLQKFAGNKMRAVMGRATSNPVRGILTGAAVTTAIQSSSATTVMVVSFVNAGLLSLAGAVAVIMGANIGTTVTAWIITLFGLGESGSAFSLPMLLGAISLVFIFGKKDKLQSLGESIIGLVLLLVGMELLQHAMPDLQEYPHLLEGMARLANGGFLSTLLFVGIGTLLTCLVQSSSAMTAITLAMCAKGWIGLDIAVPLVMGQNIGTTITANIAAMVANTNGKRAARAHLVFNVIGVILTLIVYRPVLNLIAVATNGVLGNDIHAAIDTADIPLALSLFHTFFNVVNTLILVWFIPTILKIVNWMVKENPEDEEDVFTLKYIGGHWVNTSEISIQEAQSEIENFSKRVLRMYTFLPTLRNATSDEEFNKTVERIEKYEGITDRMEMEIAKFLTKTAAGDLSQEGSRRVSSMLRIVDNLESIGDTIFQIAMTRKNKRESAVKFDDELNENLARMTALVQTALDVMDKNLTGDYDHIDLESAYKAEQAINHYRDVLRARHLDALKLGIYDFGIGNAYSALYALYEKLGDYVINVSEAIDNSIKAAETLGANAEQ